MFRLVLWLPYPREINGCKLVDFSTFEHCWKPGQCNHTTQYIWSSHFMVFQCRIGQLEWLFQRTSHTKAHPATGKQIASMVTPAHTCMVAHTHTRTVINRQKGIIAQRRQQSDTHSQFLHALSRSTYLWCKQQRHTHAHTHTAHMHTHSTHHPQQLSRHPPPICCAVHMVSLEWDAMSGEWEERTKTKTQRSDDRCAVKRCPVTMPCLCLEELTREDNNITAINFHTAMCNLIVNKLHHVKVSNGKQQAFARFTHELLEPVPQSSLSIVWWYPV